MISQPYVSLEAALHDAFWAAEDDGSEVRLMSDFLRTYPGRSLEIGAGSGRLIFPLLDLGFEVEGLELSNDMLAIAKLQNSSRTTAAVFHQGDMADWDDGRQFASLMAPAFTLQLADDPASVLAHWHDLIEGNGGLYLTVFIPFAELHGDLPENEWYADHQTRLPDGRLATLETRHSLEMDGQRVVRDHRYTLTGETSESHVSR